MLISKKYFGNQLTLSSKVEKTYTLWTNNANPRCTSQRCSCTSSLGDVYKNTKYHFCATGEKNRGKEINQFKNLSVRDLDKWSCGLFIQWDNTEQLNVI